MTIKTVKNLQEKFLLHFQIIMRDKCFFGNMNLIEMYYIIGF
jgi:hypothetical protein